MKKIFKIMILISLSTVLVSCVSKGEKKETKETREIVIETEVETEITEAANEEFETTTYAGEVDGIISEFTFYHKGDKVYKQTAKNIINYAKLGIANADAVRSQLDPIAKQYQNIAGITHSIEYGDTEAVETLLLDYLTLDYEAAKSIPGIVADSSAKIMGVSLVKSAKIFEDKGYVKQ